MKSIKENSLSPQIKIDLYSEIPVYKQIISAIEAFIEHGIYKRGDFVPSMNELAANLEVSKETIKKVYGILRDKGVLESVQGKGFYVNNKSVKIRMLLLFDKLSTYKQILYNSFVENIPANVELTIRLHNQDPVIFKQFIEENNDKYDYYIITPHFSLDPKIQKSILQTLKKIPNRKLILLDRLTTGLIGNFGCIYQDFESDVYNGLLQGLDKIKKFRKLIALPMPGSLYAPLVLKGIKKFCAQYKVSYEISKTIQIDKIQKNNVFLVINGQLDVELINLAQAAKKKGYLIGKDIGIIAYNESPINEIILNGLSVLSTNFEQMGSLAAKMISEKSLKKIKCDFRLIERGTF